MRLSPIALVFGLAASSMAVPSASQRPDDQIAPRSTELLKKGEAAAAAGKYVEADDAFETALAVDPRNRAAFVAMASNSAGDRSAAAVVTGSPAPASTRQPVPSSCARPAR